MGVKEAVRAVLQRRPSRMTAEEYLVKLSRKGLKPDGTFAVDPMPMAPPIGYKKQPSMVEVVRDMVRSEKLRIEAERAGYETFEEAEDFEVGEDPEVMRSVWENEFDPPLVEMVQEGSKIIADREAAVRAATGVRKSGGSGGRPPEAGEGPEP